MKSENKPLIAITMGDPAGIGPEIVVKALVHPEVDEICRPVIYGDLECIRAICTTLGLTRPVNVQTEAHDGDITVYQATNADLSKLQPGTLSPEAGRAAAQSVIAAAQAAIAGRIDAIVTAPLNKEAIALAGYNFPGHTELLAHETRTESYGMLLVSGPLRVVHVSTHVSLREAIDRVRTARVLECIVLANEACRLLGIGSPRIAVAGLNPHAGEGTLFGEEDEREILPAIVEARSCGIDATGPHPPDTVFERAARGLYDLVVAMYHDQGHIPVKLFGFDRGVNITIGLPIIRVSVDHGTAFDIAGKGLAREQSMIEAIRMSVLMSHARARDPLTA